jgi:Cyclin
LFKTAYFITSHLTFDDGFFHKLSVRILDTRYFWAFYSPVYYYYYYLLTYLFIIIISQAEFQIKDYLPFQSSTEKGNINAEMRSVLVDWMVEVQETFELNHETLYLAVKLVDLYLGKVVCSRLNLQLLGATAIFVSSKFDVSLLKIGIFNCVKHI